MDLQSKDFQKKKSYEGIAVFIAVFSLLAAIVGVVLQFRAEKKRVLTCNVTASTELTSISAVPELHSKFTYKGKEVTHLWKLVLNFVNTGNETLIGKGPHNNLMGDDPALSFEFPKDSEILNIDPVTNDVDDLTIEQPMQLSGTNTVQNSLGVSATEQKPMNRFRLRFSQWRPNERVTLSMYIASPSSNTYPLLPTVPTRDIVDGDVFVRNSLIQTDQQRVSLIDRLPFVVSFTVKFFISLVCGLLVWFGIIAVPKETFSLVRLRRWKKTHLPEFTTYVNAQNTLSAEQKQTYIDKPQDIPSSFWEHYPGVKLKSTGALLFTKFTEVFTIGLASVLIGLAGAIYLFSNVYDLARGVASRFF